MAHKARMMDTNTLFTILGFVITALSFIGALITVWVNLTNKLTLLEARLGFGDEKFNGIDKKFDEVMMHLRRIEDKLDNKADRP
jgi:hypothetical protein